MNFFSANMTIKAMHKNTENPAISRHLNTQGAFGMSVEGRVTNQNTPAAPKMAPA
jgi:hypothetical protein